MTKRILLALLASATLVRADVPATPNTAPKAPIYEETFNTPELNYINGASIGPPGSGVSGKPADRAYVATPKSTKNEPNSPAGLATTPIAPNPLSAFTCTFWYYLDEEGPELQVPLSTAAIMFLSHKGGFEIRIENQLEAPRFVSFTPGVNGPLVSWRARGQWIFAAFSWDQQTNTFVVHQGTPNAAVTFMRDMAKPAPGKPTLPRTDLDRYPEVVGNTSRNLDRPLAGRMDNLRFYDRVVALAELEAIRKADLADTPLPNTTPSR